jgi:hypothetical protein
MWWRRKAEHLCLTALPNATIEHMNVLANQARDEGFEVCWLDLGHEPDIAAFVQEYSGCRPVPVHDEQALRDHVRRHRPVSVWLHTPYPEHYPEWFWRAAEDFPLAYTPYGATIPATIWEEGAYGLETFHKCTWLLASDEDLRDGWLAHGVPAERIVLAGDKMRFEIGRRAHEEFERHDLLWAPHWIEDMFGKGSLATWRETAPVLLDHAGRHPEISLLVRPHPFLEKRIDEAPEDDPDARVYRRLLALPNVQRSTRTLVEDVLGSDALISEGMSVLVYFATLGRPIGMLQGTLTEVADVYLEILAACDALPTAEATRNWLETLPEATANPALVELMKRLLPEHDRSPIAIWNEQRRARSRRRTA